MDIQTFLRELQRLGQSQRDGRQNMSSYEVDQCSGCAACMFSSGCTNCYRCTHCTDCSGCTHCTHCMGCTDSHDCAYCTDSEYCIQSAYLTSCVACSGCTYCFGCVGLVKKEFCILNVQYPRKEFFELTAKLTAELRRMKH